MRSGSERRPVEAHRAEGLETALAAGCESNGWSRDLVNMSDNTIIDQVDGWERERIQLQHRRRRLAIWLLAACVLTVGTAHAVIRFVDGMAERRAARSQQEDAEAQREADRQRRLEQAWYMCTEAVGTDVCNDIESRLAERCLGLGGSTDRRRCLELEVVP